jgi:superfamily I DNA/RNA helicase
MACAFCHGEQVRPSREELMLGYVAITRAKAGLDNTGVARIHQPLSGYGF